MIILTAASMSSSSVVSVFCVHLQKYLLMTMYNPHPMNATTAKMINDDMISPFAKLV